MIIKRVVVGCAFFLLAAIGAFHVWLSPTDSSRDWLDVLNARKPGRSDGLKQIDYRFHLYHVDFAERYHANGSLQSRTWILHVVDKAGAADQIYRRTLNYENGNAVSVVVETPWRKTTAPLASELATPGPEEVIADTTPVLARPLIRVLAYGLTVALGLGGVVLLVLSFRKEDAPPKEPSVSVPGPSPPQTMGTAATLAYRFWTSQLSIIQEKGILAEGEKVEAMVGLFKRSQLVFLAGILARFLQKQYLLVVTEQRVLLVHIPAFMVHGSGYHQYAEVPRPCRLELQDEPHGEYFVGAKVDLPDAFAALVGRPFAYVVFGLIAQDAFERAGQGRGSVKAMQRKHGNTIETPSKDRPPVLEGLIRFLCPECGKSLKAQRAFAGRRVKCSGRKCGKTVQVPADEP